MADFRIRVVVDPSGATKGTRKVETQLNRVGDAATRVQRLIARAFAFAGLGVGLNSVVRTLANFEQQMSTVRAITGATESQFRALRLEAQKLGSTTRFSASEAAEGMQFLARAGFDVNQVLASIDDTLLLAQAGALDLGSAADIASNILTGFRLNAAEAGRVVDVLALASNSANTNVFQLGEAMKFVAPVAAGLGVSLEEAAAAISALSDAGLQGSLAGTGLRRVLAELESPASKTRDILKSLDLAAEDVRVSQVGLTTALIRLRDAGVDTGLALEIFGDRGGPAFEVLSQAIPRVEELTGALNDAEGTALRIATVMDDNLNGALLAVRSAFEGLILAVGESGATGVFTTFLAVVAEGIRFLTENIDSVVRAFEVLSVIIVARFGLAITGAVAKVIRLEFALGASSVATAAFSASMKIAQRAVWGLTAAIAANPLGALVVALSAVVGFLYVFSDGISVSADNVVSLGDVIRATFGFIVDIMRPVVELFSDLWTNGLEAVERRFGNWGKAVAAVISALADISRTSVNLYIGLWVGAVKTVIGAWGLFPEALKSIGAAAVNGLISIVDEGISNIVQGIGNFYEFLGSAFTAVGLDNPFAGLFDGFSTGLDALKVKGQRAVSEVFGDIGRTAVREFDQALNTDYIGTGVNAIMDRARELAEARAAQTGPINQLPGPVGDLELPDSPEATGPQGASGGSVGGGSAGGSAALGSLRTKLELLNEVNTELDREADLLRMSSEQREVENALLGIQQRFQQEGIALADVELAAIREKIAANKQLEEALNFVGDVTKAVFGDIDSALADFIRTGEFNFREFATNIVAELARITTQAMLIRPLLSGISSMLGGNGFTFDMPNIGSIFNVGGNQFGGSVVGGSGGPDSQLFVSKVSPGERVDFTPEGEGSTRHGRGDTYNFNITTPDVEGFKRSQSQVAAMAARSVGAGRRNM